MPKCNLGANCDASSDDLSFNFFKPGLDPNNAHKFDARIDWAPSQKQRIFGRFSYDKLLLATFNAFGNMWDLNYAQNVTNGRDVLVADDYTLNPTTVLQLRYSFVRHHENQGGDPSQNGFDITQLGFPSSLAAAGELQAASLPRLRRQRQRRRRHRRLQHLPVRQRKL